MTTFAVRSTSPVGRAGRRIEAADPVVVDRVTTGWWMPMNLAERLAVVDRLTSYGLSAAEIARRTRLAQRSVERLRQRLRDNPAEAMSA